MDNKPVILQLQTFPAISVGFGKDGLTQFRKEVIKVGKYIHPATKKAFEITVDTLNHWVSTFNRWIGNGNQVPIPLGHSKVYNPEANAGWVTSLAVDGNSLVGIMELSDPKLALTTDVSICVEPELTDGKGVKYSNIISHIALCTDPVIAGLDKFMKLSLSKGETDMVFLKKIAEALGIKDAEPTEELVLSAVVEKVKSPQKKVELSQDVTDYTTKILLKSRAQELSGLVKEGKIAPAVKDEITAKFLEPKALELSVKNKVEDGFDALLSVLVQNHPNPLLVEQSKAQSLELSNLSAGGEKDVDMEQRRAAAKNQPGYVVP